MRNRLTYPLVLTAFLLLFSHGMAKADCYTQCDADYASCNHNCPQCPCYEIYQACFDGCQFADTDHDGITDDNDNCPNTPNANQADCDGDRLGNACDAQDNSYTFLSAGNSACDVQTKLDWDLRYYINIYYQDRYRSGCTGQTCFKKWRAYRFKCDFGENLTDCCKRRVCQSTVGPCPPCDIAWNDACSYPRCPF